MEHKEAADIAKTIHNGLAEQVTDLGKLELRIHSRFSAQNYTQIAVTQTLSVGF